MMSIDTSKINLRDITLLYDTIDLQLIDVRKLKNLFDIQPVVMDTPELLVIIFPPIQLVIQLGDRRLRVTHQQPSTQIDALPLWQIVDTCRKLLTGSRLEAYGFNYNIVAAMKADQFSTVVQKWFFPDPQPLTNLVKGELLAFTPRLKFKRGKGEYDLILEHAKAESDLILEQSSFDLLKAHLNIHFAEKRLPAQVGLKTAFLKEYEDFQALLHNLFNIV